MLARESLSQLYQRVCYASRQAFIYKKALNAYRNDENRQISELSDLNCRVLKASGIQAVAIDFDGVLASQGKEQPLPRFEPWLKECLEVFGPGHVFIYTNRPTLERQEYFQKKFPGIEMIEPSRKKPYPDGVLQILKRAQVNPAQLLIIDDRLLTGVLSAIIVGVPAVWVTQPLVCLRTGGLTEFSILLLRKLERLLF